MSDARQTPANGRVAHSSLKGRVKAAHFSDGTDMRVVAETAPILASPGGARNRELLLGEAFCVLETRGGAHFGFARRDGYVGWVPADLLAAAPAPSHRVGVIRSLGLSAPDLKDTRPAQALGLGSLVHVTGNKGDWSRVDIAGRQWFVPTRHLAPVGSRAADPVAVAELFLGTPYLWGGNSARGIDCSGLVQAAMLACGIACPGDSDQQEAALGTRLPEGTPVARGDLLFWKGHVALAVSPDRIIHANAQAMAVTLEDTKAAIARIEAAGEGPVRAHKRL
ncbi:MAG TPA: NLP/P60 hydrolase [Aliiroseovarius sp.]|nr:NLP/P60 hydrolase [Aliiroseovarius sp.]